MGATQQATAPLVLEERSGAVLTLRLNRPEKLNALNPDLCRALVHGLLRASEDKSVRAVVLTGAGRGFCSGGDIDFLRDARNRKAVNEFKAMLELGKEICLAIASMPKVVIAAVNGPAAGGGMSLALACDLRIASEPACSRRRLGIWGCIPISALRFFCRGLWAFRALRNFFTRPSDFPLKKRAGSELSRAFTPRTSSKRKRGKSPSAWLQGRR